MIDDNLTPQEQFDDAQIATAGLAYYLYRQAGCPFGDSLGGLNAWLRANVTGPFEEVFQNDDEKNF